MEQPPEDGDGDGGGKEQGNDRGRVAPHAAAASTAAVAVEGAAERLRDALGRHKAILRQSELLARDSALELLEALSVRLRSVDGSLPAQGPAAAASEAAASQCSIASAAAMTTDQSLLLRPLVSAVQEVLGAAVVQLGRGDSRIRSALLALLPDLEAPAARRVVLEALPWCAFPVPPSPPSLPSPPTGPAASAAAAAAAASSAKKKRRKGSDEEKRWEQACGQVVEALRALAGRDPASLPAVLECLGASPLHESYRDEPFRAALRGLGWTVRRAIKTSKEEVGAGGERSPTAAVMRALLSSPASLEEGAEAWEALRGEWEKLEARAARAARRRDAPGDGDAAGPRGASLLVLDAAASGLAASCSQLRLGPRQKGGGAAVLARAFLQPLVDDAAPDEEDDEEGGEPIDGGDRGGGGDDDDRSVETSSGTLSVLDWVGLLVLSQAPDFEDSVDRIADASIRRCRGSLRAQLAEPLQRVLRWIAVGGGRSPGPSQAYLRLAPALPRLGAFLLLSPARVKMSPEDVDAIRSLAIALHGCLDPERQRELVQCYLHLLDEVVGFEAVHPTAANAGTAGGGGPSGKRGRSKSVGSSLFQARHVCELRSKQQSVRRLINSVLGSLVSASPAALDRFKEVLVRQLVQSSPFGPSQPKLEDESIQDVCRTVARLTLSEDSAAGHHGFASTDVVALAQKLLFSSSSPGTCSPSAFASGVPSSLGHRGIQLATELVRSGCLSRDDETRVEEWVVRSLMPATRRMVDPTLGRHGLHFLDATMAPRDAAPRASTGSVFGHLKRFLSNTGLVQILDTYQSTRRKDTSSVLAYREVPPEFSPRESEKKKTRDIVICIAYFLRRSDDFAPSKWEEAVTWAYELANMYLRLGREVAAKGWRSEGWLVAPLELPCLRFPPYTSDALSAVEAQLRHFDVAADLLLTDPLPLEAAARSIAELDVKKSVDAMICFTLSLWVAVALSMAVMKNSYENLTSPNESQGQSEGYRRDRRLLQFQLLKIRCLTMKIQTVVHLFESVLSSFDQRLSPNAVGIGDAATLKQVRATVEKAVSESKNMERLFEPSLLGFDIILDFFCTDLDADFRPALLKLALETNRLDNRLDKEFRSMKLKGALAEHIASTLESPKGIENEFVSCMQPDHVAYILRLMKYLVDIIPRLRKGYFACHRQSRRDGLSLEAVISLEVSVAAALKSIIFKLLLSEEVSDVDETMRHPSSDVCFEGVRLFRGDLVGPTAVPWRQDESLYVVIHEMLSKCDCLPVATSLIEVLAVFTIIGRARHLNGVASSSFRALHTIYAESKQTHSMIRPLVVDYHLHRLKSGLPTRKHLFQRSIGRLCLLCREGRAGFSLYRVMIVQYFSVLALSGDLISRSMASMDSLVQALVDVYQSPLDRAPTTNAKRNTDREAPSATKSGPPLPFLAVDFYEDYFEFLLNALIGVLLIRKILLLYKNRFTAFSKKCVPFVFEASRLALASTMSQIQRCVSWRNNQPYPVEYANGSVGAVYDPGSTIFLKRLLDVASDVFRTVFDVCDVWQGRTDAPVLLSKSTRLRQCAQNTSNSLDHVASVHNWPPPLSKPLPMSFDDIIEVQNARAREDMDVSVSISSESYADDGISGNDSDTSFCATGDWG